MRVACDLRPQVPEYMAARMNMLKLLQEVEGFAAFSSRKPQSRPPTALLLQFRPLRYRQKAAKPARIIRIRMLEPIDVGVSIPIRFAEPAPQNALK